MQTPATQRLSVDGNDGRQTRPGERRPGNTRNLVLGFYAFAVLVSAIVSIGGPGFFTPTGDPGALMGAVAWVFVLVGISLWLLGNRDRLSVALGFVGLVIAIPLYAVSLGWWDDYPEGGWDDDVAADWAPYAVVVVVILAALNAVLRNPLVTQGYL